MPTAGHVTADKSRFDHRYLVPGFGVNRGRMRGKSRVRPSTNHVQRYFNVLRGEVSSLDNARAYSPRFCIHARIHHRPIHPTDSGLRSGRIQRLELEQLLDPPAAALVHTALRLS